MSMKTAQEWQEELAGETSVESIKAIQADALRHAAAVVKSNLGRSWSICGMENSLLSEATRLTIPNKLSGGGDKKGT
jgi:hypothetical protein